MDYLRSWIGSLLVATLMMAAGASAMATGDEAIYQLVDVSNHGVAAVTHVRIEYGDSVIPSGTAHSEIPASGGITVGETRMMPIPQTTTIRWTSADGRAHSVNVPTRTYVADTKSFHGFEVSFVDDYVIVYRLSRTNAWPKSLDLKRAQVFTSKS